MAIISVFEHWRHKFEGLAHSMKVITDHKNQEYFIIIKQPLVVESAKVDFYLVSTLKLFTTLVSKEKKPDVLTIRLEDLPFNRGDERTKYQS